MDTTTYSNVHAAEPMERDEWLTALSELSDVLESIERLQRLHAHSIVHIEDQARQMHGHVQQAIKLSDEARVVDYNNINSRANIANDRIIGKLQALDDALNDVAKQFCRARFSERELISEGLPATAGDDL